tara:strand:+ start:777 stop:1169 length:393 start_codon:yes stop_codon:yes gene_type:complete
MIKQKQTILNNLKGYNSFFYFDHNNGLSDFYNNKVWGSKEDKEGYIIPTRYIIADRNKDEKHYQEITKLIRTNGIRFMTADDDEQDKAYGYYLNEYKNDIDLEPMTLISQYDLGHVRMYYKEGLELKPLN